MESRAPSREGPFVQIAAFCERVIEDKRGVLSLIGVVDRLVIEAAGVGLPSAMPTVAHQLVFVIALKSGAARGAWPVRLQMEGPDGLVRPGLETDVHFEGEDRGANIVLEMGLQLDKPGLYWFDVYVSNLRLTRMPFRLIYTATKPS